jgi:hypothetical protein
MNRLNLFVISIAALTLFASCSASKEPAGVWVNSEKIKGKSFKKIFIVVMTADIEARSVIENDLATEAREKGYQVVKSIDAIPPSLQDPKLPAKEEIMNKVKDSSCDAIFVCAVLKNEDAISYTKEKTTHAPNTGVTYYGGSFFGYYNNYYSTVTTRAYYTKEKTYYIQSNLYDVPTQEIMWSVRSEILNPSSLKNFSIVYSRSLILKLENSTLLQKAKKGE